MEGGERLGEGEALVEEETDGEQGGAGSRVATSSRSARGESRMRAGMAGFEMREMGCERGSDAGAVGDDLVRGECRGSW